MIPWSASNPQRYVSQAVTHEGQEGAFHEQHVDRSGKETRYHRRVIKHSSQVSPAPWTATSNDTLRSDGGRSRPMRSSTSALLYMILVEQVGL